MTQEQAIAIARDYLREKTHQDFNLLHVFKEDCHDKNSVFYRKPTWTVWFDKKIPDGVLPREIIVHVHDASGKIWEIENASRSQLWRKAILDFVKKFQTKQN